MRWRCPAGERSVRCTAAHSCPRPTGSLGTGFGCISHNNCHLRAGRAVLPVALLLCGEQTSGPVPRKRRAQLPRAVGAAFPSAFRRRYRDICPRQGRPEGPGGSRGCRGPVSPAGDAPAAPRGRPGQRRGGEVGGTRSGLRGGSADSSRAGSAARVPVARGRAAVGGARPSSRARVQPRPSSRTPRSAPCRAAAVDV